MHRLRAAVVVISASFLLILEHSSASAQSAQALMNCQAAFYDSTISERLGPGAGSSNAPHDNTTGNATKITPYDDQHRWETYVAFRNEFERLWLRPSSKKELKKGNFATFKDFPMLTLEDRDGDGKADFYSYDRRDRSGMTQEFGAFFDLNGDSRPDWIVYYGGLFFTKNMKLLMWYHSAIDTNGDGRFDVRVYGAIDLDGDGLPDEDATAWVYDTNYDGLVDKGEYIVDGRVIPIKPENGVLQLHYLLDTDLADQPKIGRALPVQIFADIARDIAVLSTQERSSDSWKTFEGGMGPVGTHHVARSTC